MTEKPHHALGVTGYGFGMAPRGRRQERTAAPRATGATACVTRASRLVGRYTRIISRIALASADRGTAREPRRGAVGRPRRAAVRRAGARRRCLRGGSRPGAPGPLNSVRGSPSRKPGRFRFCGRGRPAPRARHAPRPARTRRTRLGAGEAIADRYGPRPRSARIDARIASVRVPYGSGKDAI